VNNLLIICLSTSWRLYTNKGRTVGRRLSSVSWWRSSDWMLFYNLNLTTFPM